MTYNKITAPVPKRNRVGVSATPSILRANSSIDLASHSKRAKFNMQSMTPDPPLKQSHTSNTEEEILISDRLQRYNLDYPENVSEYEQASLDGNSKWFSREKPRKLKLSKHLPYQTETAKDQARYISHVLVHLYIAIKSLDIEGLVNISTKDLASVDTDTELTLDTDFFGADISFDYDNDHDEDEDGNGLGSGVIGKILPRSAAIINVNHWTNELKTCLKMKFDIPLSLRASLAQVYYHLALCRGQEINLKLFIDMFVKLTLKYRMVLGAKNLLILDHQVLMSYCQQFYPNVDPDYDTYNPMTSKDDKHAFVSIMRLALHANPFFETHAMRDIFNFTLSKYSIATSYISLTMLCNLLPVVFGEDDSVLNFVPSLFHFWTNNTALKSLDINIIDLLGRISTTAYRKAYKGSNGITVNFLSQSQLDYVFNRLQNYLRNDFKITSFTYISSLLVNSIDGSDFMPFYDKLRVLLNCIQTYVHPSNSGEWSSPIAKFCHRFIKQYHKRALAELEDDCLIHQSYKLNSNTHSSIIEAFKNILEVGSQAKNGTTGDYYIASLGYLSDLDSENKHLIIDQILVDFYDCFTDQFINSSHRIITSLKQFTEVSRFMIHDELYRVHITNIMSLLVNKIGAIDLNLTNNIFNSLITVSSLIPFKNLTKTDDFFTFEGTTIPFIQEHLEFIRLNPRQRFIPDQKAVHDAFLSSTQIFDQILKALVQKLYLVLESDLGDKLSFKITQAILILTQSLSEEQFRVFSKELEIRLFHSDLNEYGDNEDLLANIFGSLVKYDNSLSHKYFRELNRLIREQIEQGAGSRRDNTSKVSPRDRRLVLYTTVLGSVLEVSNSEVLKFRNEYLELIHHTYISVKNPSLFGLMSHLITKCLKNLSTIKVRDNRLFSEDTDIIFEHQWGGKQFDKDRFDEIYLKINWFTPTNSTVSFAVEIFETVVLQTLSKTEELSKSKDSNNLSFADEFSKNLLYIYSSLSGISLLFDPDFSAGNNYDTKTSLEKKLLILKSLRISRTDENEMNVDIEEITQNQKDLDINDNNIFDKLSDGDEVEDDISENFKGITEYPSDEIASSRILTPSIPHESDQTSVMNPTIASREERIYGCGYFFGSTTAEKHSYVNYMHLHSLRQLVGQGLHNVYKNLTLNHTENVALFQSLLHAMHSYFCDVGKSCTLDVDNELIIDYTFLKKVQSVGNHKKPFTRACITARIEKYHNQRVTLHSTNRFQTKLDKIILEDIVQLATSPYTGISLPARVTLIDSMKKLIGSYNYIIESLFSLAEKSISVKDWNSVEACLNVFKLKKIFNKLSSDCNHIGDAVSIISDCLKVDNPQVSLIAQKLLSVLCTSVKIPSEVALFNIDEIDKSLRPSGKCIDLQISTVKAAKNNKRILYYQKIKSLKQQLIEYESENNHWKLSVIYLRFLTHIQGYYEFSTDPSVLELFIAKSKSHHPELVHLCIKSLTKLLKKTVRFATFEYDMRNSFNNDFLRNGIRIIQTSNNFSEAFDTEMNNYKDPNYFIDGRAYEGWLFWNKNLKVIEDKKTELEVKFDAEDNKTLKTFGSLITKDWVALISKVLTQANEVKSVFQSNNVNLFSSIVYLASLGYTSVTYQELLHLITDSYDKDEKASVILTAEVICGLLLATDHTSEEDIEARDSFLDGFLDQVLTSDVSPDTSSAWNIVFWWVPSRIDPRRIPILSKKVSKLEKAIDIGSDLVFIQSARISFAKSYFASVGWRFNDYIDVLDNIIYDHPYQIVRDQVGSLLSTLNFSILRESYEDCNQFIKAQKSDDLGLNFFKFPQDVDKSLKAVFADVEEERLKTLNVPSKDLIKTKYFYMVSTLLAWLTETSRGLFNLVLAPYLKDQLIPFLMNLENNRELCKLASIDPGSLYENLAMLYYRPEWFEDIFELLMKDYESTHQVLLQLSFIQNFFTHQLLQLSKDMVDGLVSKLDKLLFHQNVEVRIKASDVLSNFIHTHSDISKINEYIDKYVKCLSKKRKHGKLTTEKLIELHGSVIGVGAYVKAFPYFSSPSKYLLDKIAILASAASIPGIPGKSAKDTLSNFKEVRADTWHIDRLAFSEDQLEDLEGVLWKSYYA